MTDTQQRPAETPAVLVEAPPATGQCIGCLATMPADQLEPVANLEGIFGCKDYKTCLDRIQRRTAPTWIGK